MKAAERLGMRDKIRSNCMCFLIGLLYSTGLRISEALSLTKDDVDLINLRVFIKKGKFGKQRYVPLDESVAQEFHKWNKVCEQCTSSQENPHIFIDQSGKKLTYSQVNGAFTSCRKNCDLMHGRESPRLHDFRHTYACNCILKWQITGDVNTKLPILATALGHVHFESTQVYLHINPAQLQQAAGQFQRFYTSNKGDIS